MPIVTKLGPELMVNSQTANWQMGSSIASLSNGGFVVAWQDGSFTLGDPDVTSIKAQIFSADGTAIGGEFLVNTQTNGAQYYPVVTGLSDGGFVISWFDTSGTLGDSSAESVKAQVFDAHGVKVGSEFLINAQTANSQVLPTITALTNGRFVVSWSDGIEGALGSQTLGDTSGSSVKAQLFGADGTKIGAELLVNTQTTGFQHYSSISGINNGGFVVTWSDNSGTLGDVDGYGIKAQLFDGDGIRVGTEFLVNTESAKSQYAPIVAGLSNGGFVVTWSDTSGTLGDTSAESIKAQVFDAHGVKVGSEFLVNTEAAYSQHSPTITGLSTGGFVVTWSDTSGTLGDTSAESIKAQVFDAHGVKVGSEFLVNTITNGSQQDSSITGLIDGRFIVSWTSFPTDKPEWDLNIKAQIFSVINEPIIGSNGGGATAAVSIAENSTAVTMVTGTDADTNTTLSYSISSGADAAKFQINASTGVLSFLTAPNFEAPEDSGGNNVYDVEVQVSDGSLTDKQSISVTVTNVNETPVITSGGGNATAATTIAENTSAVTTVTAADSDTNTTLSYSISGGADAALFQIDAITGALSFKTAPDFEAPTDAGANNIYDVIVQVTDGALTDTQAIAVTVTNISGVTIQGGANSDMISPIRTVAGQPLPTNEEDTLRGNAGNDTLDGGGGNDLLQGGTGIDRFIISAGADAISDLGSGGADVINVSAGATLNATVTSAWTATSATVNRGIANITTNGLAVNLTAASSAAGSLGYVLTNIGAATTLTGSALADRLTGGTGNDVLDGKAGTDTLNGGDGSDIYLVTVSADHGAAEFSDTGVSGTDEVRFAAAAASTLTLFAGDTGIERIVIGIGAAATAVTTARTALNVDASALTYGVSLTGNAGANILTGGSGDDTLIGGAGNDTLNGSAGLDYADYSTSTAATTVNLTLTTAQNTGSSGTDLLSGIEGVIGGSGADTLTGDANANILIGNAGIDRLNGGGGDDQLRGGNGNDILTGGAGIDWFIFDVAPNTTSNRDTINDFVTGTDKLQFSSAVFTGVTLGTLSIDAFWSGAGVTAAHDPTDRFIYNTTTGILYFDADGNGNQAAVQVALLGTANFPSLAYTDIQIIG